MLCAVRSRSDSDEEDEKMKRLLLFALLLSTHAAFAQARYIAGVRVGPPPGVRTEVPTLAPSPRHQWIAGYWARRGGTNVWIAGHWALPPGPSYIWEPARWENQMFYDGYWRPSEAPDPAVVYQPPPPPVAEVVVAAPPPQPIEEVRPPQPFDAAIWIPGYWHWSGGQHLWVAGRWSARPSAFSWEQPHWDRRDDGRWAQRPGHWEHHHEHEHEHDEHHEHHERH
jgi:hypothetical protein